MEKKSIKLCVCKNCQHSKIHSYNFKNKKEPTYSCSILGEPVLGTLKDYESHVCEWFKKK